MKQLLLACSLFLPLLTVGSCCSTSPDASPAGESAEIAPEKPEEIATEEINYRAGGTTLSGYLARPTGAGDVPGVLVVHEWWGHTDFVRDRARQLAELGYAAFALDMYGDGKLAEHPRDATAFMNEVMDNAEVLEARFDAALDLLRDQPGVDPSRIAAIGYCMGGGIALRMARAGADLAGVVSFHGSLGAAMQGGDGPIDTPILVCTGAADPMVPEATVEAFEEEWVRISNASVKIIIYADAMHGFTNPDATAKGEAFDLPLRHDAEADAQSWAAMERFLAEHLKP